MAKSPHARTPLGKRWPTPIGRTANLKSVTDPLGNFTASEYDDNGRQTLVRDALNRANRFEYDGAGRMIKTIFANNSFITNLFNNVGQRVGAVDQAGLQINYGYDLSGQLTNVAMPSVPDPEAAFALTNPTW